MLLFFCKDLRARCLKPLPFQFQNKTVNTPPVTNCVVWVFSFPPLPTPYYFAERKDTKSSFCELPRCSQPIVQNHCQVKLGSTDSMSVKKSILDGRLLPGKSVLIPGLIRDQRLLQNDMPLVRK
uniref:Uncharacterized protein n=1 Tax=Bubo bubo TaxID=30461 RepID=A0A8C0G063_BUBBB